MAAGVGGCATVAGLIFAALCFFFYVLNRSFYDACNPDLRPELYFRSDSLAVVFCFFVRHAIEVSHEKPTVGRGVMGEHIQRVLTSMEAFVAQFRFLLHIFLSELKLEIPAFHFFIGAFVDDHLTFLPLSCIFVVVVGSPSLTGAFLFLYSSCWRRIQRRTHAVKLQYPISISC